MDTNRFSHPQGVDCEQSSLIGIRIQQGNRNSTDFTKQATCNNESLPRKNEHKELLFSVGPVLLLDHLEVPYIQIDSDLTTTTEKNEYYTCVNGLPRNLPPLWNRFHLQVAYR